MEEALLAFLVADPGVYAIAADRQAWNARPQGEGFPCVVLHRITGGRDSHMTGRSGLVDSLVQVDCWAETWVAAKALARAIIAASDGLTAAPFQRAFVEGERDTFETDDDGRERHRTLVELRVWHADAS